MMEKQFRNNVKFRSKEFRTGKMLNKNIKFHEFLINTDDIKIFYNGKRIQKDGESKKTMKKKYIQKL